MEGRHIFRNFPGEVSMKTFYMHVTRETGHLEVLGGGICLTRVAATTSPCSLPLKKPLQKASW